jgi:hypothetical protein
MDLRVMGKTLSSMLYLYPMADYSRFLLNVKFNSSDPVSGQAAFFAHSLVDDNEGNKTRASNKQRGG